MKFRQFIIAAADHIGRQYLPVRDTAHEINDFVGPDSVHDDLAPRIVRAVYKANRCGHLDASINADATFDALGRFHGELIRNQRTDYEQIQFVQILGELTSDLLNKSASTDTKNIDPDDFESKPRTTDDSTDPTEGRVTQTDGQSGVLQFNR